MKKKTRKNPKTNHETNETHKPTEKTNDLPELSARLDNFPEPTKGLPERSKRTFSDLPERSKRTFQNVRKMVVEPS